MTVHHPSRRPSTASRSSWLRPAMFVCFGLWATVCILQNPVSAQQPNAKKTVQVVDKFLVTDDGWQIPITYRNSLLGQNAPVAVLIPRLGTDRIVWEGKGGLAEKMSSEGFAVISVDLRKQGQSKAPDDGTAGSTRSGEASLQQEDYEGMVYKDLEAVKDFLYREHQAKNLNMNKTAIVAAESSAPIAILYTVHDWSKRPFPDGPTPEASTPRGQDIRSLVLLSPEANLRGVTTNDAILMLREPDWGISSLSCYGTDDKLGERDAERIYTGLTGKNASQRKRLKERKKKDGKNEAQDEHHFLAPYPFKLRGVDLLKKEVKCEADLMLFLKTYVKDLPGEWRDRKNRLANN